MKAERRFNLIDGMILVAAIAGGFALRRGFDTDYDRYTLSAELPLLQNLAYWMMEANRDAFAFLLTLTVAIFVFRLRRPRARLIRLAREPGLVACFVALVALVISLLPPYYEGSPLIYELERPALHGVACAVAGAWLTLAVSGRWRPHASWIDRLGRACGIAWLAMHLLEVLAMRLVYLSQWLVK